MAEQTQRRVEFIITADEEGAREAQQVAHAALNRHAIVRKGLAVHRLTEDMWTIQGTATFASAAEVDPLTASVLREVSAFGPTDLIVRD